MESQSIEDKKIFLIASSNKERSELYSYLIRKHISQSKIYFATDGNDAIFKITNDPPHVILIDNEIAKTTSLDLTEAIINDIKFPPFGIVIVSEIPDTERFVDNVVTGHVQFFSDLKNENIFNSCIVKALNFYTHKLDAEYRLRFLAKDDVLFSEGEKADCAFIVKKGELKAFKNIEEKAVYLGSISEGEFVGEMAHLNGGPRSATVSATKDCELIEIPFGTLDLVLFSKPAWSKALVMTLSKRLKNTNEILAKKNS